MINQFKNYRTDIAVLAHRAGRVLVLHITGYNDWRVPQEKKEKNIDGESMVKKIMENVICCREFGPIRETRVTRSFDFSEDDKASAEYDMKMTSSFYFGKNLQFYIAELLCRDEELEKGERVEAFTFLQPSELEGYLPEAELSPIEEILSRYTINV